MKAAHSTMIPGIRRFSIALALVLMFSACGGASAQGTAQPQQQPAGPWQLTWSDEFDSGGGPDATKWVHEVGGGGWGNNELEYYTTRPENSRIENGNLVISALKESYTGTDGVTREYTSARLKTAGKFTQKYGRFEARIKVPTTKGIWPAFWMLGDNIATVGWPKCGELDIMEYVGSNPTTVLGTLHGPGYSGAGGITKNYMLPNGAKFPDDFHVFAVEWEPNVIRFYVDDTLYATRTPADLPGGATWVFDHPFFIILNVAVGGGLPGNPDETTVFPQHMLVDYVRVYRRY